MEYNFIQLVVIIACAEGGQWYLFTSIALFCNNFSLIGCQNEEQIFFNIQSVRILLSIIRKLQQKGPPKALNLQNLPTTLTPKTKKERQPAKRCRDLL